MIHGITPFTDLSNEEFKAKYLTRERSFQATSAEMRAHSILQDSKPDVRLAAPTAPIDIDWTTKGRTTAVKDQGKCGSCWAFGIVEQIESDTMRLLGVTYILSPQQVVDCDTSNDACDGGFESPALTYVQSAGLCKEADYPYTSGSTNVAGTCKTATITSKKVIGLNSFTAVKGEGNIADFVAKTGPITLAIDATTWDSYTGGVMTTSSCPASPKDKLNHVVQAVGLKIPTSGQAYWKVRNQWSVIALDY